MTKIKEPWGEGHPWKSSTAFFTYLRGCLRKAWMRHPVKLNLIKNQRKQIKNPNPRGNKPTVWGFECELCNKDYVAKEGQVDHRVGAGKLTKTEDIQGFTERLLYVTEDDLRYICKSCHGIVTLSERRGISFEEAAVEKRVISFGKLKAAQQSDALTELKRSSPKTKKGRVELYREILSGEE